MEDTCVCCGRPVTEGDGWVCHHCSTNGVRDMDTYTATELAYKKGYSAGRKDALSDIAKDESLAGRILLWLYSKIIGHRPVMPVV